MPKESWQGEYLIRVFSVETKLDITCKHGEDRLPRPADARPNLLDALDEPAQDSFYQPTWPVC